MENKQKLFVDVYTNTTYIWNGSEYEELTGDGSGSGGGGDAPDVPIKNNQQDNQQNQQGNSKNSSNQNNSSNNTNKQQSQGNSDSGDQDKDKTSLDQYFSGENAPDEDTTDIDTEIKDAMNSGSYDKDFSDAYNQTDEQRSAELHKLKQNKDFVDRADAELIKKRASDSGGLEEPIQRKIPKTNARAPENLNTTAELRNTLKYLLPKTPKSKKQLTSRKPNRHFDPNDILAKSWKRIKTEREIPTVSVYFDQSASWNESDIAAGNSLVQGTLQSLQDEGKIKFTTYYFSNGVTQNINDSCLHHSTPCLKLMEHIEKTRPDNIILMTDSDFDRQNDGVSLKPEYIKGSVWFIFRNSASEFIQRKLLCGPHSSTFVFYLK